MARIIGRPNKNDLLLGEDNQTNYIYGDVIQWSGYMVAGDDHLIGGDDGENHLYGDAEEMEYWNAAGGNDRLEGGDRSVNFLYGDAGYMNLAVGGDDLIFGGNHSDNTIYGDAQSMTFSSQGGNDVLFGGDYSTNTIYGDGYYVYDFTKGGDDTITGGDWSINILAGDMETSHANGSGGNDVIYGGNNSVNHIYGGAQQLNAEEYSGRDRLIGGADSVNYIYGDAHTVEKGIVLSDDTLVGGGGDSVNWLYGDGYQLGVGSGRYDLGPYINILGGDTLVSGTGIDHMWGDAAVMTDGVYYEQPNVFVFRENSGQDFIYDFDQGNDQLIIDLPDIFTLPASEMARSRMPQKVIDKFTEAYDFENLIIESFAGDSIVHFSENDSVTIFGVASLYESDFVFV